MRLRLLGEFAIEVDGREIEPPASRRGRTLLAWLALHPGPHSRGALAARFWPDVLDSSARASLRTALHELRRDLGPGADGYLGASRDRVELLRDGLWVDVAAFAEHVAAGEHERALALRRGELLSGLDDDWVVAARDTQRQAEIDVLERLAAAAQDAAGAVRFTRAQVELDPLSEAAHRRLMARLADAGDRAAALTAYERLRERLRRELSVAPSAATRAAAEALRSEPGRVDSPRAPTERSDIPVPLTRRRETRFVGRAAPLALLESALRAAGAGHERRIALVEGAAGIGKTRLVAELAARAHPRGVRVLLGRCFDGVGLPYGPLAEAVGGLPALDERLEPEAARLRLFESVGARLVAGDEPVLLVLDDLHWADSDTLRMLAHVLRAPDPAPLLVVATIRSGELDRGHPVLASLADLRRDVPTEHLRLDGLTATAVAELVAAWPGRAGDGDMAGRLHEETGGHPYHVEQLLRHLDATGATRPLPEDVVAAIGARVARLGSEAALVLDVAAVAGREFELAVLERVPELSGVRVLGALDLALAAVLVREVGDRPGRFGFDHALVHETLYAAQSRTRRARRHAAVADALQHAPAAEIAHHRLLAGEPALALPAVRGAARAAIEALAWDEAADWWARAVEIARSPRDRADGLVALAEARRRAGRVAVARSCAIAAAAIARELTDGELLARAALAHSGVAVSIIAVDDRAVALLEEALAAGPHPPALEARLVARLAIETYYARTPDERGALGGRAVALARRSSDPAALAHALDAHHAASWSADLLDTRLATARELLALAEREGAAEHALQAHAWLVLDHAELGELDAMRRHMDAHERLADDLRLPGYRWWGPMWRSTIAILEARPAEAARWIAEFEAIGREAEDANAALYGEIQRHGLALESERPWLDRDVLERQIGGPAEAAYRAGSSFMLAIAGEHEEARAHLAWVTRDPSVLPDDMNMLAGLCELTQTAWLTSTPGPAAQLYARLVPYRDRVILSARGGAGYGSAEHHLGLLAALEGRDVVACEHFERARERNTALGARGWVARTLLGHGEVLRRSDPGRGRDLLLAALAAAEDLDLPVTAARARRGLAASAGP